MEYDGVTDVEPTGFRGHTCAFCGVAIPVAEPAQFPLDIGVGGQRIRLWAHRECLRSRVRGSVHQGLDALPLAREEDVWPRRPA
jgi:hypothetical protein